MTQLLAEQTRLELAIEMYRTAELSMRSAAEFAGMDRWQFMDVLMERDIPLPYTKEMVDQDFAYARSRV